MIFRIKSSFYVFWGFFSPYCFAFPDLTAGNLASPYGSQNATSTSPHLWCNLCRNSLISHGLVLPLLWFCTSANTVAQQTELAGIPGINLNKQLTTC